MNQAVNDIGGKMAGSAVSAVAGWGLQDVSFIMAIIASCFSVVLSCFGISQIIKQGRKK